MGDLGGPLIDVSVPYLVNGRPGTAVLGTIPSLPLPMAVPGPEMGSGVVGLIMVLGYVAWAIRRRLATLHGGWQPIVPMVPDGVRPRGCC
jgi:hypothetical protein